VHFARCLIKNKAIKIEPEALVKLMRFLFVKIRFSKFFVFLHSYVYLDSLFGLLYWGVASFLFFSMHLTYYFLISYSD